MYDYIEGAKMSAPSSLTFEQQTDAIASMMKSALGAAKYDYLSGPITGGPRFIEWEQRVGSLLGGDEQTYRLLRQRQVIDPNIKDLIAAADVLREKKKLSVIEPGSFESPNQLWSQNEFYRFWESVITDRAERVIFCDGWETSVGCTYEYLCAIRNGQTTLNSSLKNLPQSVATKLIISSSKDFDEISDRMKQHKHKLLAMAEAIKFSAKE